MFPSQPLKRACAYFVKLSLAVNLVLVDERQHDPVADDGALEGESKQDSRVNDSDCSGPKF